VTVFIEIVLPRGSGWVGDPADRQEIEDAIEGALASAGIGEVTGGGTGVEVANIDVDIFDESELARAIPMIRVALLSAGAPPGTTIKRTDAEEVFEM
jgi:hypothetical protein